MKGGVHEVGDLVGGSLIWLFLFGTRENTSFLSFVYLVFLSYPLLGT